MTCLDVRAEAARPRVVRDSRGVFGWICTNNPFYVLSATCLPGAMGLVRLTDRCLADLVAVVGDGGYAMLLAMTACLLVRYVGVWDDVRTVMLLVVLMFLATSVTFDEVLARDPIAGLRAIWVGSCSRQRLARGCCAAFVCVCRSSSGCRIILFSPYSSFIRWPSRRSSLDRERGLSWALFAFSPAAARRLSHARARDPSRPRLCARQRQPVALGVVSVDPVWRTGFRSPARSALLCWSMHHVPSAGGEPYIFAPYFLVPFGLAIAVVLLEFGLVERQRGVCIGASLCR